MLISSTGGMPIGIQHVRIRIHVAAALGEAAAASDRRANDREDDGTSAAGAGFDCNLRPTACPQVLVGSAAETVEIDCSRTAKGKSIEKERSLDAERLTREQERV